MALTSRSSWQEPDGVEATAREVGRKGRPLAGPGDLDDLVASLAEEQYVLLGEASHGTSQFYSYRAHLTARLLREADFDFVAVEGDWPACYALDRFVKGLAGAPATARGALAAFDRWPTWMWANWELLELLEWLELHNAEFVDGDDPRDLVGFYGLDVYGLFESMHEVVEYLEGVDPEYAAHAREAYRCFEAYGGDAQAYARSTRLVPESCQDEVVDVLAGVRERLPEHAGENPEDRFGLEQNALVAQNAESYYRALTGPDNSWNVRDEHMADTLDRLVDYYGGGKAIVWAHNTHVGDARATDMPERGRLNLGQLVRERHDSVGVVGFGTHHGHVVAGDEWGARMRRMQVPDAKAGSYEDAFYRAGDEDRLLFTDEVDAGDALADPRGHRAIGVVYRPALESGNYVPTDLRERYDAYIHLDQTDALHPLELHPERERVPDLYPSGL
ncbi:MAG: erythromycin esterase family protein [Haloferacaceae archaeon]